MFNILHIEYIRYTHIYLYSLHICIYTYIHATFYVLCIFTYTLFIYFLKTVQSFHIVFSQVFLVLLGQFKKFLQLKDI